MEIEKLWKPAKPKSLCRIIQPAAHFSMSLTTKTSLSGVSQCQTGRDGHLVKKSAAFQPHRRQTQALSSHNVHWTSSKYVPSVVYTWQLSPKISAIFQYHCWQMHLTMSNLEPSAVFNCCPAGSWRGCYRTKKNCCFLSFLLSPASFCHHHHWCSTNPVQKIWNIKSAKRTAPWFSLLFFVFFSGSSLLPMYVAKCGKSWFSCDFMQFFFFWKVESCQARLTSVFFHWFGVP